MATFGPSFSGGGSAPASSASERAARLMLGHLDQPGASLPQILDNLTIRYATLSAGERVMLEAAHSFWNGLPGADLSEILSMLDSAGMQRFVDAVAIRTGKRAQV